MTPFVLLKQRKHNALTFNKIFGTCSEQLNFKFLAIPIITHLHLPGRDIFKHFKLPVYDSKNSIFNWVFKLNLLLYNACTKKSLQLEEIY